MNFISKVFSKDYSAERIKPFSDTITHLDYPEVGIHELLKETVDKFPKLVAYDYFGKESTFERFYQKIEHTAKAFKAIGVKKGDRVTISMPNTPEAITAFYAINMIGATANMIHPLSSENEVEYYVEISNSKYFLTLDKLKNRVLKATKNLNVERIIICSVDISMPLVTKTAYNALELIKNRKNPPPIMTEKLDESHVIMWNEFYDLGYAYDKKDYKIKSDPNDEAVILYSGGTTGKPKGVRLSNMNFNAMALQAISRVESAKPGNSVLSLLPIFHGFGLGCCVHTILLAGVKCYLIPQFKPEEFVKLIKKTKPNFVVGVPTMFEALINSKEKSKTYLRPVTDVISGGDTLKSDLRKRINQYLADHGSKAQVRVGYGLSESVAVCILCPSHYYKENAIGLPMPNTEVRIVKPGTTKEVKPNKLGEICVTGPSVMMGYLNEPIETENTLKTHYDGKIWLHTGDIGYKNRDGIVFFESRLKRMIVTSGYNVYPNYIEQIIASHPAVEACVVVGVPHPYRKQVPVANVVLHKNHEGSAELTRDLIKYCEKSIAKYSMPVAFEYIKSVPKTLIGKVNYRKLEEDCAKKHGKV